MNIEAYPIDSYPSFGKDYIDRVDAVLARFDYDISDPECWQQRASWLDQEVGKQGDRQAVADVLTRYNQQIGNSERTMKNIQLYAQGKALTVVGGQQACLFTGPMFVIYKAITVIQTARKAEAELNRPVIPLFWIAGEDHDWQEVNELYLPSTQFEVNKFELSTVPQGKQPVTMVPVEREQWITTLNQMRESLIETEFTDDVFKLLHDIVDQSNTIVECFARMLAYLFGDSGLVLLDSGDPLLRLVEKEIFSFIVEQNDRFVKAFEQGTEKVIQLGFEPQVSFSPESAHLFYLNDKERSAILREGNRFKVANGNETWSTEQLIQHIQDHPQRFSNNVISRPLMQEALFPVLAVVLGRSEIAYWGQLKEVFHCMGMRIPLVISRTEVTIVEGMIDKQLRKYEWSLQDVCLRYEEKKDEWLAAQDELKLDMMFSAVKRDFLQMYDPLLQRLVEVHPGLDKLGQKNRQKILEQIIFMEKRAQDALTSKFEVALRHMKRMKDALHPLDRPQERVHNVVYYWNKYGLDWLHELLEMDVESGRHYALYL